MTSSLEHQEKIAEKASELELQHFTSPLKHLEETWGPFSQPPPSLASEEEEMGKTTGFDDDSDDDSDNESNDDEKETDEDRPFMDDDLEEEEDLFLPSSRSRVIRTRTTALVFTRWSLNRRQKKGNASWPSCVVTSPTWSWSVSTRASTI